MDYIYNGTQHVSDGGVIVAHWRVTDSEDCW